MIMRFLLLHLQNSKTYIMKKENKSQLNSGTVMVSDKSNLICLAVINGKPHKDKAGKEVVNTQLIMPLAFDEMSKAGSFPEGKSIKFRPAAKQEAAAYFRALADMVEKED